MNPILPKLTDWRNRLAPVQARIAQSWQNLAPVRARALTGLQRLAPLKQKIVTSWQRLTANAKPRVIEAWTHLRHRCPQLTVTHLLLSVIALLLVVNLFRSNSNPSPGLAAAPNKAEADANTEALTNAVLLTALAQTAQNQAPSAVPTVTPIDTQAAKKAAFHRVLLEDDIKEQRTLLTALRQEKQKLEIDLEKKQNTLKRFENDNRGVLGVVDLGLSGLNAAADSKRSGGQRFAAGVFSGLITYGLATDGGKTKAILDTHLTLQGHVKDAQKLIDSVDQNILRSEATLAQLHSQIQTP